ncbi:MAG: hypothetical protein IJI66_02840 [Erysipelotrichaceae bacterium]|nr:hypothetical protein [Erysipelotrichaceae bacterium]
MIIDINDLLNDFSENGFALSKKYLAEYVSCFYVDIDEWDRASLIEKLCDYVMSFEYRNNKKDSSLPELYTGELLPIINKIVKTPKKDEVPSQAYRYAQRAQEIAERIKKDKCENLIEDLEDFTKIFLSLYDRYMKNNHEKVEAVEFKIPGIGFDYIRTDLIKEKRFSLARSKDKNGEEKINNVLKLNEKNNIYNTRNFVVMLLSLFYIRLTDLEGM